MTETDAHPGANSARRRRRPLALAVWGVLLCLVLLPAALWLRLYAAPVYLPDGLQTRIEARINAAMSTADISVGDIVLALPQARRAPALEFRDVTLVSPDGEARAALPALRVRIAAAPLLRGRMRVQRIIVSGAGLNVTRSETGRLDLDFAGATDTPPAPLSLSETLARLDRMFAAPVFEDLQEVRGEAFEVVLTDERTGRVMRLHNGDMRLTPEDQRLTLAVVGDLEGSRDSGLEINLMRDSRRAVTELGLRFDTLAARDLAASTPAMAWLDLMRAPIDGELNAALSDDGTIGAISGWLLIGEGTLNLPGQEAPLAITAIRAGLDFDPDTRRARFDDLMLETADLSFTGSGHADISPQGDVHIGQFALTDITADPEGMFDAPLAIDGADLDLRLTLGEAVQVEVGRAVIHDGDLRVLASGRMRAGPEGRTLAIDAHIEQADLTTVLSFWPVTLIPNTRWWVVDRLLRAEVEGVDFALRQTPDNPATYELSFDFDGADIRALPAAPPILDASGYFGLQGQHLFLGLDGGSVGVEGQGRVDLAGSRMQIGDVSVRGPDARFDLELDGTVTDVMHVLAGPPFAVLETSGLAPEQVGTGRIRGAARIETRLLPRPPEAGLADLDVTADAVVTDFAADQLIPDRVLTADRISVALADQQLAIGGPGLLDGVPVTGQWQTALGPDAPPGSQIEARAVLSRQNLARFGVVLPDWLISGEGMADLTVYLRANGPASISVRSDLDGLALAIPALAWRMPPNRTGSLAADIRLGPDPFVSSLTLEGAGLSLDGAVTFTGDGQLDRLTASRFRLGQWLDVEGALVGRRDLSPGIEISGGILDFRTMPSLSDTGGGTGNVGPLTIALDRLQITGGIALTDLRAEIDGDTMGGDFRGSVNGAAPVSGQLVRTGNGPSVRLQSADGGAVIRAAGIFDDLHGGAMDLIIASRPERGEYDGQLNMDAPRMRNAPAMAELLNVISVVGLLDQLSGEGINMGEVEARFRITPETIFLDRGTAVGPSMGVSMDGVYDVASTRYEMQGVFSPLYIVNGLVGALFAPRREGLFGFSYRLIFDGENTRISVNPLSILTPGIFREIFRAPPPDFSDPEGNG